MSFYKIVEEYRLPSSPQEVGIYQSADGVKYASVLYKSKSGEEVYSYLNEIFRSEVKGEFCYSYINPYYPHYYLRLYFSPHRLEISSNQEKDCGRVLAVLPLENFPNIGLSRCPVYNSRGDILLAGNTIYLFPRQGSLQEPVYDISSPLVSRPEMDIFALNRITSCQLDEKDRICLCGYREYESCFHCSFNVFSPDLENSESLDTNINHCPYFFSLEGGEKIYYYVGARELEKTKKITIDFGCRAGDFGGGEEEEAERKQSGVFSPNGRKPD